MEISWNIRSHVSYLKLFNENEKQKRFMMILEEKILHFLTSKNEKLFALKLSTIYF